jgi:hypothetical protein
MEHTIPAFSRRQERSSSWDKAENHLDRGRADRGGHQDDPSSSICVVDWLVHCRPRRKSKPNWFQFRSTNARDRSTQPWKHTPTPPITGVIPIDSTFAYVSSGFRFLGERSTTRSSRSQIKGILSIVGIIFHQDRETNSDRAGTCALVESRKALTEASRLL